MIGRGERGGVTSLDADLAVDDFEGAGFVVGFAAVGGGRVGGCESR